MAYIVRIKLIGNGWTTVTNFDENGRPTTPLRFPSRACAKDFLMKFYPGVTRSGKTLIISGR